MNHSTSTSWSTTVDRRHRTVARRQRACSRSCVAHRRRPVPAIDDLDISPTSSGPASIPGRRLARRRPARPDHARASASTASSTSAPTKPKRAPASPAARRAPSKARCTWPARRCRRARRGSTTAARRRRRAAGHGRHASRRRRQAGGRRHRRRMACQRLGRYSHLRPDPVAVQPAPHASRPTPRAATASAASCRSGYGCPPDGPTQELLDKLGRHGNRPAHIHFFVTAPGQRKLTTQINIAGDSSCDDDFAFATPRRLILVLDKSRPGLRSLDDDRSRGDSTSNAAGSRRERSRSPACAPRLPRCWPSKPQRAGGPQRRSASRARGLTPSVRSETLRSTRMIPIYPDNEPERREAWTPSCRGRSRPAPTACDRSVFTDEQLFELEMKHIFEGNWVYLAHESQIPQRQRLLHRRTSAASRSSSPAARTAAQRVGQHLHAPRRHPVPPQAGQQVDLHLPVPRLDVQQQRQAAEGQGPGRTPATRELQLRRQPRPEEARRASRATAASCSAASIPMSRRWRSTWAKRPRSST